MPQVDATFTKYGVEKNHEHNWTVDYSNPSQKRCTGCLMLLVSPAEFAHRCEEWNAYLEQCRQTDSYKDYVAMRQAFSAGDKELMHKVLERVKKRCKRVGEFDDYNPQWWYDEEAYLPKPIFPDPLSSHRYVVRENTGSYVTIQNHELTP